MMMSESVAEHVYPRLPVFLQNAACWYYGTKESRQRFGGCFDRHLDSLLDSEKFSAAEIEAHQDENLRALIRYAYENVPYYRQRWQALRITPADIRSRADLPKLPILTKEDVVQNREQLLSRAVGQNQLSWRHTSGTTGKALHFYVSKDSIAFQWAIWWRHRLRFGLQPGSWHANFTGKRVVPLQQQSPPYWRWNRPMRQALINMQHITPAKIGNIMEFLNSNGFEFYSGYPSIIHALATTASGAGLALTSRPRVISTGAENMLDFQRRDIANFTGAVLTDQYGCSEGCGNASHCPNFAYHEDFEFGILEGQDRTPGDPAKTILCTGFASKEFPFIRYEVGDTAVWGDGSGPCPCGRSSRVLSQIQGRNDDCVVTPEGARIMRFDYILKDVVRVKEAQVVQRRLGEVVLRVVRRSAYCQKDEDTIRHGFAQWISAAMKLNFEYVDEIERERNGKFRAVVSHLHGSADERSAH
jgi:phenylacetate-CoA ligase